MERMNANLSKRIRRGSRRGSSKSCRSITTGANGTLAKSAHVYYYKYNRRYVHFAERSEVEDDCKEDEWGNQRG
jgi:hypothetical protein